ncbi:DUF4350 domain-containing protein [Iamia sp. SCSIO 61187]|uniref:DUF4350 domain-containing protein n=1 Tax=Iamia sp. SCSIO 61187 TaxID=2722752 RepID=UPI001C631601|nr:DUF4350 domain-containing protein [Iamia sp. SCSIO 61187]QYG92533.1 DUF4350 domain-containing protein [Iamia sp. SCSIO 61187]
MTRRRGLIGGALVIAALLAILVLSNPQVDRYSLPSLSPRGTGPSGTAALVELIRQEGADVTVGGRPDDDDDVVLVLRETLSGDAVDELRGWVRDGGTLVVSDVRAELAPASGVVVSDVAQRGPCPLDALADVDVVDPPLPAAFATDRADAACFVRDRRAGLAVDQEGFGLVVGLSSSTNLTNEALGDADNAVLAAAILAPWEGADVRILDPNQLVGDVGEAGDGTVLGALPLRGSQAVTQLVIAFLAWGLIRARRLGRPVVEELPVPLPASDLVLAAGHLLDRNGDAADATERLRRRARRDLGSTLGLGADPPPQELAAALQARAGVDGALVHAALLAPVVDEAGLVTTSAHLDRLRRDLSP